MLEKIKPYIKYIILSFVAILFILLCRGYLYNDGIGTDQLRKQYEQLGTNQQQITTGIKSAEESVNDIEKRISSAEESVSRIENDQHTAGELLQECKSILAGIRERSEKTKP